MLAPAGMIIQLDLRSLMFDRKGSEVCDALYMNGVESMSVIIP